MLQDITVTYKYTDHEDKLSCQRGESLFSLCQKAGLRIEANCGGRGVCGGCKVRFLSGAPLPKAQERKLIPAEELRDGYRLLCLAKAEQDCTIALPSDQTEIAGAAFTIDQPAESDYICVDIGTTTVVVSYRDGVSGKILLTKGFVNPQRAWGADVISRLDAACSGKMDEVYGSIRKELIVNINNIMETIGRKGPVPVYIGANTSMLYLLMGFDVRQIAQAPFAAEHLSEERDTLAVSSGSCELICLPGFSAFVGADIYADLLALSLPSVSEKLAQMKPPSPKETESKSGWRLLIDLGTNAETVLFTGSDETVRGYATASAAGSAFDKPAGSGLWGADLISLCSRLLKEGVLDHTGAVNASEEKEKELCATYGLASPSALQQVIRELQLAKAAVRTGIDVLLREAGLAYANLDGIYLAGGFGKYLNMEDAVAVGLLPMVTGKEVSCGNLCILGVSAYAAGKRLKKDVTCINLAQEPDFQDRYMGHVNFPGKE
ncbi:MAG: ASKHA domain-containing protein [Lachnospiraceae bacterium]|nr:ASKHA domain-containing protein [Lachnospiraceae bacterium]